LQGTLEINLYLISPHHLNFCALKNIKDVPCISEDSGKQNGLGLSVKNTCPVSVPLYWVYKQFSQLIFLLEQIAFILTAQHGYNTV